MMDNARKSIQGCIEIIENTLSIIDLLAEEGEFEETDDIQQVVEHWKNG